MIIVTHNCKYEHHLTSLTPQRFYQNTADHIETTNEAVALWHMGHFQLQTGCDIFLEKQQIFVLILLPVQELK